MKKPIVVNFFGGPSVGKSTTAARVFSELKMKKYKCELVTEYAKDLVYQKSFDVLENQIYVFAHQHQRMNRLKKEVDVIITDSPLLLSQIYGDKETVKYLSPLILHEINKFDNINILLTRTKEYQKYGRTQTLEEAVEIDTRIREELKKYNLKYHVFEYPINESLNDLVELINEKLNKNGTEPEHI